MVEKRPTRMYPTTVAFATPLLIIGRDRGSFSHPVVAVYTKIMRLAILKTILWFTPKFTLLQTTFPTTHRAILFLRILATYLTIQITSDRQIIGLKATNVEMLAIRTIGEPWCPRTSS